MPCDSNRNITDCPVGLNGETPFLQAFQYSARSATTFSWSFRKLLLDHDSGMKSSSSIQTVPKQSLSFRAWRNHRAPSRILVIRLHAIGDVAITFPACSSLRQHFPTSHLDFLTSETCADLPKALTIFNRVHIFPHAQNRWERLSYAVMWSFALRRYHYDVIIDLQRNWVSRMIRFCSLPRFWGEFDRVSPKPAGDCVLETFHMTGFETVQAVYRMSLRADLQSEAAEILMEQGWDKKKKLVVLNPAGLFPTRNWPTENYAALARLFAQIMPAQFVILGTSRVIQKAERLKDLLPEFVLNLVGKTTLAQAFGVLQYASLIISEDSGLMHMACVSGIPTLALFGSTDYRRSRPTGNHSVCLHSGDLECGCCMSSSCKYGDVHCLTRYTPEYVFQRAHLMISNSYSFSTSQ